MLGAPRSITAAAVLSAAVLLAACGHSAVRSSTARQVTAAGSPEHVVRAPKSLISAIMPLDGGIMWGLAGITSKGLYQLGAFTGQVHGGSVSVSRNAQSVTESARGVLGLALGSRRSGALELLSGRTAKPMATVALPAPARQVVAGRDGSTFYVLTAWARSASVSAVSSTGRLSGTVPVPGDAVSITPNPGQTALYVLQRSGLVDEISLRGGRILATFQVGHSGISLALSPDGSTLYVLKGSSSVANIAVVDVSTESVRRVLPAPSHCREVLVSASGDQLYEVVGAARYGNVQVFAA